MQGSFKRVLLIAALGIAAMVAIATTPADARAQTANLSVRVVLANNNGGGVDSALASIASPLRSRFGQYGSFRQISSHSLSIGDGGTQSIGLPNGQTVQIGFQGMSGGSYRLEVRLPGGGTTVTAPPGGIFFVAGPRWEDGILIVAITP